MCHIYVYICCAESPSHNAVLPILFVGCLFHFVSTSLSTLLVCVHLHVAAYQMNLRNKHKYICIYVCTCIYKYVYIHLCSVYKCAMSACASCTRVQ